MRYIALSVVASLLVAGVSARTLEVVEGSYEAILANVVVPQSTPGSLTVSSCASCPAVTLITDSDTIYVGISGIVSLQDFRTEVAALRETITGNQTTAVGVFYQAGTNRVTRVSLHAH